MSATIQLRLGDMFVQPADLIIIPCSTGATITSRVAASLRSFQIDPPRKLLNLGEVEFRLFEGASSLAAYVGYAASVEGMRSTKRAITEIAKSVASFAAEKSEIRDVSIPLLGSGSGRLSPIESAKALIEGLEALPTDEKVYNIFVHRSNDYSDLTEALSRSIGGRAPNREVSHDRHVSTQKRREPLRVFISYTRTSTEHEEWVRSLAAFLRQNGVDARLDVWHLRPGMDLPQWMSNELDLADRVLIICNEEYSTRADGRLGGVGWEIRLVQGDLLQSQNLNPKKYLPLVRSSAGKPVLPKFLQGTYCLSLSDSNEGSVHEVLLKELYEIYEEAPPIGTPPRYVLR